MLKYTDTKVTFAEVPDEISLCINISNCPNHCKGCHSPYLTEDIGILLTDSEIYKLINNNHGISCICFMGGDLYPSELVMLALYIKSYTKLKVAWYSGNEDLKIDPRLGAFDYIKIGSYKEELGPLNSKTTNQKMFKIICKDNDAEFEDITHLFQEL